MEIALAEIEELPRILTVVPSPQKFKLVELTLSLPLPLISSREPSAVNGASLSQPKPELVPPLAVTVALSEISMYVLAVIAVHHSLQENVLFPP